MAYKGDYQEPPWYPQQGHGQQYPQQEYGPQYPQNQSWHPQPYVPQSPRQRSPGTARRITTDATYFLAAAVISFAAGWGGLALPHGSAPGGGTKTAATGPAAAPASCPAQVQAWVSGGAVQRIDAFSGDLDSFATAAQAFASDSSNGGASAGDVSGIQAAAAAIQSDATGAEASPGPSCVPGLRANLAAAAGEYSKAASDADNGMSEYTAGDINTAASDIDAASSALGKGNAKLTLADTAVTRYKESSGG